MIRKYCLLPFNGSKKQRNKVSVNVDHRRPSSSDIMPKKSIQVSTEFTKYTGCKLHVKVKFVISGGFSVTLRAKDKLTVSV